MCLSLIQFYCRLSVNLGGFLFLSYWLFGLKLFSTGACRVLSETSLETQGTAGFYIDQCSEGLGNSLWWFSGQELVSSQC